MLIDSKIEVIRIYEEVGGVQLGISLIPLVKRSPVKNVKTIRAFIEYASQLGVNTLIFPPGSLHGLTLSDIFNEGGRAGIHDYCIRGRAQVIRSLKKFVSAKRVNVILTGVLEKYGNNIYYSNMFIDSETGAHEFFGKKILTSEAEEAAGIRPGRSIRLVDDGYAKFNILLGEDALAPELARLSALMGCNMLIVFPETSKASSSIENVISALGMFTGLNIAGFEQSNKNANIDDGLKFKVAISLNGDMYKYSSTKALITIPYKVLRNSSICFTRRSLVRLARMYAKHLLKQSEL